MKYVKTYESFLLESSDDKKITEVLRNLKNDPKFIEYLHDKGKKNIQKVSGAELTMGLCTYVAKYVEEVWGLGQAMGSHGPADAPVSHAFIVYNKKFYDASSPKGVNHVWELFLFDDASYSTRLEPEEYNKVIEKNIQPFELER